MLRSFACRIACRSTPAGCSHPSRWLADSTETFGLVIDVDDLALDHRVLVLIVWEIDHVPNVVIRRAVSSIEYRS